MSIKHKRNPLRDSDRYRIHCDPRFNPIQVHYWVNQPGKKSVAATVKSKSSMGQPWTENSRAVINFSPHCSHHLRWGLWGKSAGSVCSQDGHGGIWVKPLSVHTSETVLTHYMNLPDIHTDSQEDCDSEGGRACLRKCKRRRDPNTSHTEDWTHTRSVTVLPHCRASHPKR